jgi:hypothetical protein
MKNSQIINCLEFDKSQLLNEINTKIKLIESFINQSCIFGEIDYLMPQSKRAKDIFDSSMILNIDQYFAPCFDILDDCNFFVKNIDLVQKNNVLIYNESNYYIKDNPESEKIKLFINRMKVKYNNLISK